MELLICLERKRKILILSDEQNLICLFFSSTNNPSRSISFLLKKRVRFVTMDVSRETNVYRKWFGVLFLLVEMNLLGGTIFGFASIFEVLSKLKIYQNGCESSSSTTTNSCSQQTKQYQVSLKK
jgi:hypothetical protein